ncbi:hypothetical protein AAHB33_09955 [Paenarthrobacter sp. S56]|uniref:LolA family protein n=1 Tax=Paenarthrobacter sp. S56 TaxID=3138179 RepID=UPI00321A87B5
MVQAKKRWLPALLVPVALLSAVLVGSVQAGAAPSVPPKTPDEILAMAISSDVRSLSGTVSQVSNLGLPELPVSGPSAEAGAAAVLGLLAGSHEARLYLDAPSKARLQILDPLAERDVVVNGTDAWFYNSADNSAIHAAIPAHSGPQGPEAPATQAAAPDAVAKRLLEAVGSSTEATQGEPATVAGRSAYTLVLKPRAAQTLVDSVTINVDSGTGLPPGGYRQGQGTVGSCLLPRLQRLEAGGTRIRALQFHAARRSQGHGAGGGAKARQRTP